MASNEDCRQPEGHLSHICQLRRAGLQEEAARRSANPAFVCFNCGAMAAEKEDLCNPGALPRKQ